jgi:hypothetical protein
MWSSRPMASRSGPCLLWMIIAIVFSSRMPRMVHHGLANPQYVGRGIFHLSLGVHIPPTVPIQTPEHIFQVISCEISKYFQYGVKVHPHLNRRLNSQNLSSKIQNVRPDKEKRNDDLARDPNTTKFKQLKPKRCLLPLA